MKTRIVLTLIAAATLAGCGGSSGGSDGTSVVAAFYPLAFAAEQIGGADVSVTNLTPPGVEPHDLELSGSDIRTIADADLVLYLRGLQPLSGGGCRLDVGARPRPARPGRDAGRRPAATRTSGSIRSGTP